MKKLLETPDYLALLEFIREAISLSKQDSPILLEPVGSESMIQKSDNKTIMQSAFLQLVSRLNFEEQLYYAHRSYPNFYSISMERTTRNL